MGPRAIGDYLVDVFAIGLAALIAISVLGLALDSPVVARVYPIPIVGPLLAGIRAFVQHVYDPETV